MHEGKQPSINQSESIPERVSPQRKAWVPRLVVGLVCVVVISLGAWHAFSRKEKPIAQTQKQSTPVASEGDALSRQHEEITMFVKETSEAIAEDVNYIEIGYRTTAEDEHFADVMVKDEASGRYVTIGEYGASVSLKNTHFKADGASAKDSEAATAESKQVAVAIEKLLKGAGYEQVSAESVEGSVDYRYSRYATRTTICDVEYGVNYVGLDCAPKDETAWAVKITKPFYDLHGFPGSLVAVDLDEVEKIGNRYERVTGSTAAPAEENGIPVRHGGARVLFYREINRDWKFFTGTQETISCQTYNTEMLKEVYADADCYDANSTSGGNLTVSEFYKK